MFEKKRGVTMINTKRQQEVTNGSEKLKRENSKSLIIKCLQNKQSQTKWIYTQ
jgi:hypothetical protein